ncbi:hypothetical protein ACFZ8E_08315 [Methylobacterium sp. HMF5984]|uniref:hypothetical protein n=1 Tax=Methylobacterium sp. HMF5984 TaxID=3367370 RepID=UPI0038555ABC
MRRAVPFGILLALATAQQARAEDFTGAYAGVNLAYGFERGRDAKKPGPLPEKDAAVPSANDLPPSASMAAKSLRSSRPAAR